MTTYEELLKDSKGENLNKEFNFGEPVGREHIWTMTDEKYGKEYADKNKQPCNGKEMKMKLNYNEVVEFMTEFKVDLLNRFNELIIDEPTNTSVSIKDCKDIEEVKMRVVYALCRPISKGLRDGEAKRLLERVNTYFDVKLTKQDMLIMYHELCKESKLNEFMSFIKRGFPIDELQNNLINRVVMADQRTVTNDED